MQDEQTAVAPEAEPRVAAFPTGFLWGVATSAYQIEGAADADGRGQSIWDTFAHTPGRVVAGDTGDVAADHYHRYPEDVALMSELGLGAYRFSVSWPRIQADGSGPANARGLDFYQRLVDSLLERGIEPAVTLYHWDLPQALEDKGGWLSRDTAYRFAEYAGIMREALGDRVKLWTTLNEPWCAAFLGYGEGKHAPGVQDPPASLRAAHHLLLAHGLAVPALRAAAPGPVEIGTTLNFYPVSSASDAPADLDAAHRIDILQNRLFLDPVMQGGYPADIRAHLERVCGTEHILDGDEALIGAPIDFLGVNYYTSYHVAGGGEPAEGPGSCWPGAEDVRFLSCGRPLTDIGWEIDAQGLRTMLERINSDYPGIKIMITENGAAYDDPITPDGKVHDEDRIAYVNAHLRATHEAITNGVDVRGYFLWSLLDNFEWAEGYAKRFGIVHVDFDSQLRTPKDSAFWYGGVALRNGLSDGGNG
ncbi:beta-glucosidase [Streptomyces sp. WAC 00631]|uniref:GH1 family beta-glucosidase n=1 Tax=unclassified Streptomyces TaxID=2593676 RepID=UPI000F7AA2D1|nr:MULTISPECIES: GH1 family beta-glucosidase [unclassified Streptomyces]MCC5033818.1 beta-glucosidase [Streptomyces sp. WAC 00631]MCC9742795.1 beta-glucosidase [Streptomyces sp. MNU89]